MAMTETPIYFYSFTTTYGVLSGDGYTLDLYEGSTVGEGIPLHEVSVSDLDYEDILIFASGIVDEDVSLNFYIGSEASNLKTHAKVFVINAEEVGATLVSTDEVIVQVWAFKVYAT